MEMEAPRGKKEHSELIRLVQEYTTNTETNTKEALTDQDYYDNIQFTLDEKTKLLERGQPDVVVNRTKVAINGILGVVAFAPTEPKALPNNDSDEDSANVASDCLRYSAKAGNFYTAKSECYADYLIPGIAALMVAVDADKKVKYIQISYDEYIYDHRSKKADFRDSKAHGIGKWMFFDDLKYKFPDKVDESQRLSGVGGGFGSMFGASDKFEDKPTTLSWIDVQGSRVFVVELYCKYGDEWWKHVFWAGGILEEGPSPYLSAKGKPDNPIIAVSCYVDRNNNRYGVVRDIRPIQDEINKRRSKLLHLASTSQIQAKDPSAVEVDADAARKEAARPDGVIPYGWEKVRNTDMAASQGALLAEAKNEIERFAPNPAVLGRQGSDSSGRALLTRQQAGLTELAVILERMKNWEVRVFRATWDRIQQFWDAPQVIRVTDDPDAIRFIKINTPQMATDASGQPVMDPMTGEQAILGYHNQVAEMDVDIDIDMTPQTATIMQEQLEDLMKLIGTSPAYAAQVPFELILDLMPIPRKRNLMQKLKAIKQQQDQQQAEERQMQIEMAVKEAMAKIGHTESQTTLNTAKAKKLGVDATAAAIGSRNETAKTLHEVSQPEEDTSKDEGKAA